MIELTSWETCSGLLSVSNRLLSNDTPTNHRVICSNLVCLVESTSSERAPSPILRSSRTPSQEIFYVEVLTNRTLGAAGGCRSRVSNSFAGLARSDLDLLLKRKAMAIWSI